MRAAAFATHVLGLVFTRYVLGVRPIAEPVPGAVVDDVAPVLVAVLRGQS